jgi:hypothetical protein
MNEWTERERERERERESYARMIVERLSPRNHNNDSGHWIEVFNSNVKYLETPLIDKF